MPRPPRTDRKKRVILGSPRRKLEQVEANDGYVYRYFNDSGSRLQDAQSAGYEFVLRDDVQGNSEAGLEVQSGIDSRESKVVGKGENGQPLSAYLMRKPADMHMEDQAEKQKEIDEVEKSIYRDKVPAGANIPQGSVYGNITLKNSRG